jgi:hypothetical protein
MSCNNITVENNTDPTMTVPQNSSNNNTQLTLANFPSKTEMVSLREKLQIGGLLEMIKNRMMNSQTSSVSLSMEDLRPYTAVMDKVFRSLMTDKEFLVMKTEIANAAGSNIPPTYSYTISW